MLRMPQPPAQAQNRLRTPCRHCFPFPVAQEAPGFCFESRTGDPGHPRPGLCPTNPARRLPPPSAKRRRCALILTDGQGTSCPHCPFTARPSPSPRPEEWQFFNPLDLNIFFPSLAVPSWPGQCGRELIGTSVLMSKISQYYPHDSFKRLALGPAR